MLSILPWLVTKSRQAFQAAERMSAGIRSVASYLPILVSTRIWALSLEIGSGYESSGVCLFGEIFEQLARLPRVMEHRPCVTRDDMGAGERRSDVREGEEVEIGDRLELRVRFLEERGDERRLVVQVALRWGGEQGISSCLEARVRDSLAAAEHVAVVARS